MKRYFGILGLLIGAMVLASCQGGPPDRTSGPENAIEAEAETAPLDSETATESEPTAVPVSGVTILADGQMVAVQPTLPLGFEVAGRLLEIRVAAGDTVQAGDVLAVLNDENLTEAITVAELRLAQSQNSLTKAETDLDQLLTWEPDEDAVAAAEANLASARNNLNSAAAQDAAASSSLTSAQVNVAQAERELAAAQEQYDNAFSPGREWEVGFTEPICSPGEPLPCSGITYAQRIENDREIATTRLQRAQEQLQVAQANLQVEQARISGRSAVGAQASVVAAEQELSRAQTGPKDEEIAAAQLNVDQAQLTFEQDQLNLQQAQDDLEKAQLVAPWDATVLSVEAAVGATVGGGSPIVTLLNTNLLEFHTTNLSERDLGQIRPGQTAVVTLKSYPNDPIAATVLRIGPQATGTVSDAAVFPVIVTLGETDLDIRPGMTGRVEIQGGEE